MLRRERMRVWRRNWRVLLTLHVAYAIAFVGLDVLIGLLGATVWQRGFVAGLALGGLPAMWLSLDAAQGLAHRSLGGEAERWTAQELARLGRAWTSFHDVQLETVNVDHVLVGPGRTYAVETKWLGSRPHPKRIETFARQAAHRAQTLARQVRRHDIEIEVRPLLVLWGPGARDAVDAGGDHVRPAGVTVVAGVHAGVWRSRIEDAADDTPVDGALLAVLRRMTGSDAAWSGGASDDVR